VFVIGFLIDVCHYRFCYCWVVHVLVVRCEMDYDFLRSTFDGSTALSRVQIESVDVHSRQNVAVDCIHFAEDFDVACLKKSFITETPCQISALSVFQLESYLDSTRTETDRDTADRLHHTAINRLMIIFPGRYNLLPGAAKNTPYKISLFSE